VDTLSEALELIELAATLVHTSANPKDLDALTRHLEQHELIEGATWTVNAES
jgi:putative Mg2+ transporter-C (MgtC) family protein